MTELQHVSDAIAHWRERALVAEAEIVALKEQHIKDIGVLMVAAQDDIADEREACAQICLAVADAELTSGRENQISDIVVVTATHCAERIRRRGEKRS